MKLDDKIECKVLDCSGHKAYMLWNQLMVSDNSLVLIIVDSSQYRFTHQCFRQNIAAFLKGVYERNSRAHIAIVLSKVDLMVDMSREEMMQKWNEHVHTCLDQFLETRQAQINGMRESIAGDCGGKKYVSERLGFFASQRITVEKKVIMTSAATHEGMVSLKDRLREMCGGKRLLPSLLTQLPSSWVTVEDKLVIAQPDMSVPITDVSYAMEVCVKHGLTEENCRELLNYLHQVGSILYYSQHESLAQVLFPVPPFVVTLLKAVFRHDHAFLTYDFRFDSAHISHHQFEEMKDDLVCNGIARVPMLLALWSDFHLTADRHVYVFIKLLLDLDFAYLTGSSDDVVGEVADTLGRRAITSTVQMSTNGIFTTSQSSSQATGESRQATGESHQAEKTYSCKEIICKLIQHNIGLLFPWLLNDMEPEGVGELWPSDIADGMMQVEIKYSFTYGCPLGLFERASARCHRHSNYVVHWSSGLLMCYGAVNVRFNCSKHTSPGFISLSGRVGKSSHSAVRLWHVLLRCVLDVEELLQSIPGVLADRFICSSSSTTSRKSVPIGPIRFVPNDSWGAIAIDIAAGRYSEEIIEHAQAIKQVYPSVKEGVPLDQVLSPDSGTLVDQRDLQQIAEDVGKDLLELTSIIGTHQSRISDSSCDLAAAFRSNRLMVCELYDALLDAGIPSAPQQHLGNRMLPDAASGLQKSEQTVVPDYEMVTPVIIETIAANVGHRWHEIGVYLGVPEPVLSEYRQNHCMVKEKLNRVLYSWQKQNKNQATVKRLLDACDKADVGGIVWREIAPFRQQQTVVSNSDMVTRDIILIVAKHAGDCWRELGTYLDVPTEVMTECGRPDYPLKEKLFMVLSAWTNKKRDPTVEELLEACKNAGVGGTVRREIERYNAPQRDTSR